ncbi:hypothetical protein C6P45_003904 [Maudiozyma exigua]|uniref:Tetratricopeptide SHNi-TPR domain-containing protein n=1 Tax=Maudiozyma exigua TaxID=34358 RepID=A0A9P6WBU1_MAUEX|nr:hypothetical protein C6P45_003904 [Kazachstania exigua]
MSFGLVSGTETQDVSPEEQVVMDLIKQLSSQYGNDVEISTVKPDELLKLATALYKHGISSNDLLAGGDEDDQEDDDEEEEEEQESEQDETEVNEEDENSKQDLKGFEQFVIGSPFENSLMLLSLIKSLEDDDSLNKLLLSDVYDLAGNNHLELENFEEAIPSYEKALNLLEEHYKDDSTNEDITEGYMKLCEALKWAQDTENYEKYLKKIIRLIELRVDRRKSKDLEKDKARLLELKEDLDDINESQMDIRERHPEFDSVLKRALGQLLSPDEISANSDAVINDLSSIVKKKKPKHK